MKKESEQNQGTDNLKDFAFEEVQNNDVFNVDFLGDQIDDQEETGAFEIVPGMTVEEMKTMFFDSAALIEPPYKVWQLNSKGHRYYYRYDSAGNPEFFPSVTTILGQTIPKSKYLFDWILDKGIDEAERYKMERAAYGTFMHAAYEKLIINRKYNLDGLKGELKEYIENHRLPDDFIFYADDLKKDVLAFAQFVIDYDVKPLAVEIALVHPGYGYAGMIDLPCTMKENLRSSNRIKAIVDFKSGKKGFFEESEIQLEMYRQMWNANFESHQISRVFNFAPKDWRKRPTYNLKDQSKSVNAKKINAILEIAAIEDGKKDNVFTSVFGSIDLEQKTDLVENIISLTLSELIKKKAPKEKTPGPKKAIKKTDLKPKQEEEKQTMPDLVLEAKEVLKIQDQEAKQKIVKRVPANKKEAAKEVKPKPKRTNAAKPKKEPLKTLKNEPAKNKANLLSDEPLI